jgi:ketosteroid isomerase-like protein
MSTNTNHWDTTSSEVGATERILQSVLAALNEGKSAEVADQFDDHFTFTDHALELEFSDRGRLIEFFQKSRELFPDTVVEADAISECRDQAVVQWKLKATQDVSYGGYFHRRVPISFRGVSIVHMKNGRVTRWSDYYDQLASRRSGLAAFFTEWIEY